MQKTISASLALASLTDQCDRVRESERKLNDDRAERDDMIRDCRAAKIPYTTLIKRTGLSRDRLIKIAHNPHSIDRDDD